MRPADTSPEAWKVWLDLIRKMTPAERLRRTFEFSEVVRGFGEAGIRRANPGAGEREVFLRVAQRHLGNKLFLKVYGGELGSYGPAERHA